MDIIKIEFVVLYFFGNFYIFFLILCISTILSHISRLMLSIYGFIQLVDLFVITCTLLIGIFILIIYLFVIIAQSYHLNAISIFYIFILFHPAVNLYWIFFLIAQPRCFFIISLSSYAHIASIVIILFSRIHIIFIYTLIIYHHNLDSL
jgi:hypothetical protein